MTPLWIGLGLIVLAAAVQIALRGRGPASAMFGVLVIAGAALGIGTAAGVVRDGATVSTTIAGVLPGGDWAMGVDPLSAVFLVVILGVGAISAVYGIGYMRYDTENAAWPSHAFFALEVVALALVVCARSVVPFMGAWELMAIGSLLLILTEHRHAEARRAGFIYIVATHAGTLALFALFATLARDTGDFTFGALAEGTRADGAARNAVLALALVGFGVKAGLFPLHFWIPPAHAAAPSHVSALMSGVVIKIGIYGLLRVVWLVGTPPLWWGWTVLGIGTLSAVLGVLWALAQHDIKRLLAYHSVENIGIILMGLGVGALGAAYGNPMLAVLGYGAALLHTLNHALFKSLLFFCAGAVYRETGTRDMERLGGLARRMPAIWLLFAIGAAAIVGLPPLNGFVSEWLVYRGLLEAGRTAEPLRLAVLAIPALALVGGLALACFAKVAGVTFLGTARTERARGAGEPSALLRVPAVALAAACAVIGLLPSLVVPAMMSGGAFIASVPITADGIAAASAGMWQVSAFGAVLLVAVGVIALEMHWLRGRVARRASETWGCGYANVTPRMQYTASSFAAPLVDLFGRASGVRAHRGATVFHSEPFDLVLDRAVAPVWRSVQRIAIRLRGLQQGRLRTYLMYAVATLTMLLGYLLMSGGAR
ncbi:MAG: proton-conducting transporter membrane subunit [Gemmatimonadaceae bacterium]